MKFLQWIALSTMSLSVMSINATTIPTTTGGIIQDTYIGAGYSGDVKHGGHPDDTNNSNSKYNINTMEVSRVDNLMTVVINSNFVGHNSGDIQFGDLFMAANDPGDNSNPWNPESLTGDRYSNNKPGEEASNTGTNWNYAYTLENYKQDNYWYNQKQSSNYENDRNDNSGQGRLVSGFSNSDLVNSASNNRTSQAVSLKRSKIRKDSYWKKVNGQWDIASDYTTTNAYDNTHGDWTNWTTNDAANTLTFSFDVSGTALATANQIAFRWAMTCANDIIEGLVHFKGADSTGGGNPIPEPHTILLMLLGMAGIAYKRKQA